MDSSIIRHPALIGASSIPTVTFDVYALLFANFFGSEAFQRWLSHERGVAWQLRCVGGPGAGKTTLAALLVRALRGEVPVCLLGGAAEGRPRGLFLPHLPARPVVGAIFLQRQASPDGPFFLESFLLLVYMQLEAAGGRHGASKRLQKYLDSCEDNGPGDPYARPLPTTARVSLIRSALHGLLQDVCDAAVPYLVVDGIQNYCDRTLEFLLLEELAALQQIGLRVLVTSLWAEPAPVIVCDGDKCTNRINPQIHWNCEKCSVDLCGPCWMKCSTCSKCGVHLGEPYTHRSVRIDTIPKDDMAAFIAWSLEREHGNLGLNSGPHHGPLPPVSALGLELLKAGGPVLEADGKESGGKRTLAIGLCERLLARSEGHLTLAKVQLDLVHAANDPRAILAEVESDSLPHQLVAIFDAAVSNALDGNELGKACIALSAGNDMVEYGIPLMVLKRQLALKFGPAGVCGAEDVIAAARGFLVSNYEYGSVIQAFPPTFGVYVSDRYNKELFEAGQRFYSNPNSAESSGSLFASTQVKQH